MKKYCYAYFNKLGDFFGVPFYVDHKEEFPDILRQSLYSAEKEALEHLKEEELYYLGSFDNVSGEFEICKDFVVSLSGMVEEVLSRRFGKEVVKDERSA